MTQLLRGLDSNNGLAGQLAMTHAMTGDWRNLFREVEQLEAVTVEDVQRVAAEIFTDSNRTVILSENQES